MSNSPFAGSPILIAEDDPFVRMTAVMAFEAEGFEVLEASNARESRTILENRPDVAVLFTDIDMPGGVDGVALAHMSLQTHPDIVIAITSGRAPVNPEELPHGAVFLIKPYRLAAVISTIRHMTHSAQSPVA